MLADVVKLPLVEEITSQYKEQLTNYSKRIWTQKNETY